MEFAEAGYTLGYRAVKMHGWYEGKAAKEAATARLLGRTVGARMALMLNPACQVRTSSDAVTVGCSCDEARFCW